MAADITETILSKILNEVTREPGSRVNDCIEYRLGYIRALVDTETIDIPTATELIHTVEELDW